MKRERGWKPLNRGDIKFGIMAGVGGFVVTLIGVAIRFITGI